jgi:hypothetical protein
VFRGIAVLRKNRRRAGELEGDEISESTVHNFNYGGMGNNSIDLRPLPTKADLILKDFEIPNIMAFLKKFELLNQQFPRPLKMAVYFSETVATRVLNEARRYRKLNHDLDGRDILYRGKQLLSNAQLEDVIRAICKPMSSQEMKRILRKSVFDVQKYQFFRQTSVIMRNFQDYRNYLTTYHDQFMARLLLIVDDSTCRYLPKTLDGGTGKGEGKEKGMIQYWTQGCPNRKFAYKLWKQGVDESVRKKCTTFDDFIDLYFNVVHKLERKLRRDYASILHIFDDDADDNNPEEPYDYRAHKEQSDTSRHQKHDRHKSSSVSAAMQDGLGSDPSGSDCSESDSHDEESDSESNTEMSGVGKGTPASSGIRLRTMETKMESAHLIESKEGHHSDEWLNGVVLDPDMKRPAPCWKQANSNDCPYGDKCRFSHDPEDIRLYLAAKAAGPNLFKVFTPSRLGHFDDAGRKIPSGGGVSNSPGVRAKIPAPTSILTNATPENSRRRHS